MQRLRERPRAPHPHTRTIFPEQVSKSAWVLRQGNELKGSRRCCVPTSNLEGRMRSFPEITAIELKVKVFLWERSSRVVALLALVVQQVTVAGRRPSELGAAIGARGLCGLARLLALVS